MIEESLLSLLSNDAGVSALCPQGGWASTLPKSPALPAWSFTFVSDVSTYGLGGTNPYSMRRIQIDCFGASSLDCRKLAQAISGFCRQLTDDDITYVQGCFRSDLMDVFDDLSKIYRRMLEYEIHFSP